MREDPTAFLLLCCIAMRARYIEEPCQVTKLTFGQAFIGDYKEAGIRSRQAYRLACKRLLERGFATFKGTNKGTIATLLPSEVFTISAPTKEPTKEPSRNHQGTIKEPLTTRIQGETKKHTPLPPEGEKAPTKKQENSPEIPKALDTEGFRQAWELWQTHRKEIRKPLKPTTTKLQLAKLESMGPHRAIAAIRYSIEKGWQGIYEPENSNGSFAPLFPGQKIQKP